MCFLKGSVMFNPDEQAASETIDADAWDTVEVFDELREKYAKLLAQPPRRKKLWELHTSRHCPIVGTCLGMDELRKLARTARLVGADGMNDYALHQGAVSESGYRNPWSERIQKWLEKKYDHVVRRFAKAKTDDAILDLWRDAQARGETAGGLWAALSHAYLSSSAAQRIYEEMHMLSHQAGAVTRGDQQTLAQLLDEVPKLRARLQRNSERFARDLADKDDTLRFMQQRLSEALVKENALKLAEQRIAVLASDTERLALLAQVDSLARQLAAAESRLARNTSWAPLLPSAAVLPMAGGADCANCEEKSSGRCGGSDLGGRSVLCVGGRAALYPEYRRMVEDAGGQFLIHDGGLQDSLTRLPALLARADVVVCPADCLSHNAYYAVKRYCKRFGKPCALLDRSGLTSFRKGVEAVAEAPEGAGILAFFG
jgi:hypothetical protein